jgi:hypothetical protein
MEGDLRVVFERLKPIPTKFIQNNQLREIFVFV